MSQGCEKVNEEHLLLPALWAMGTETSSGTARCSSFFMTAAFLLLLPIVSFHQMASLLFKCIETIRLNNKTLFLQRFERMLFMTDVCVGAEVNGCVSHS